jgi:hypothetical protein
LLKITGALSLTSSIAPTLTVTDLGAATLANNTKFTLISYTGAWDNGTFSGFANGDPITVGSNQFHIKYDDTITGANAVTLTSFGAAGLTGDYNSDGKVDAADYVIWRKTNINGSQGYTDWRANYGNPSPGAGSGSRLSGAAVPEPTTMGLLLIGLVVLCSRRRVA